MLVLAVIPTYNEASSIEALLKKLLSLKAPDQVLIVDDSSPDGTGDIVRKWVKKHPKRVFLLSRPQKSSLGSAYLDGFRWALRNSRADLILTMDADMSNDPKYIPDLLAKAKEFDIVIGSRYTEGGGQMRSARRLLLSHLARNYANVVFGLHVADNNSAYRCYKRAVIEKLPLDRIQVQWLSFLPEILFYCKKAGFSIAEVPIFYIDREKGASKLQFRQLVGSFFNMLKVRWSN